MDVKDTIKEMVDVNTGHTFMLMGAQLFLNARSESDIVEAIKCVVTGIGYYPRDIKNEVLVQEKLQELIDAIRNDPYMGKHEKCEEWVNAIETA